MRRSSLDKVARKSGSPVIHPGPANSSAAKSSHASCGLLSIGEAGEGEFLISFMELNAINANHRFHIPAGQSLSLKGPFLEHAALLNPVNLCTSYQFIRCLNVLVSDLICFCNWGR